MSIYFFLLLLWRLFKSILIKNCLTWPFANWDMIWIRSLGLTTHTSLSPIRRGFAPGFVNYKKGCTRFAAASDKVYQLLVHDRWFSPGPPASSTTKTGRHDIDEIFLKVALNTINQIKSNQIPENKYDRLYIRQKLWCRSAIVIRHIYFLREVYNFPRCYQ